MSRCHSGLAYSKAANVAGDLPQLSEFTGQLDRYPDVLEGQHAIRKWEYAMALRTIQAWEVTQPVVVEASRDRPQHVVPLCICDVGGAGSNFWQVLTRLTSEDILILDPTGPELPDRLPQRQVFRETVEEYTRHAPLGQFDTLTAISVIEHVTQVKHFFRACHALLKPGGLLFFTTDYWDAEGPDTAHFHWMRQRIYNAGLIRKLLEDLREVGFQSFGEADWSYHGPQCYDYSVCSVAMVKK